LKEIDIPLFSFEEYDLKEEAYEMAKFDTKIYFVNLFSEKKYW